MRIKLINLQSTNFKRKSDLKVISNFRGSLRLLVSFGNMYISDYLLHDLQLHFY